MCFFMLSISSHVSLLHFRQGNCIFQGSLRITLQQWTQQLCCHAVYAPAHLDFFAKTVLRVRHSFPSLLLTCSVPTAMHVERASEHMIIWALQLQLDKWRRHCSLTGAFLFCWRFITTRTTTEDAIINFSHLTSVTRDVLGAKYCVKYV